MTGTAGERDESYDPHCPCESKRMEESGKDDWKDCAAYFGFAESAESSDMREKQYVGLTDT